MPVDLGAATLASVNAYANVILVKVPPQVQKVSVQIVENDVNAIKWKIDGSIDDGTTWEAIRAEQTLAKAGTIALTPSDTGLERLGDPWKQIRVQHKSSVAGVHGNTTVTVIGQ